MPRTIILGLGPESLDAARDAIQLGLLPVILASVGPTPNRWDRKHRSCRDLAVLAELHSHQLVRAVFYVRDELCSVHTIDNVTGELNLFAGDFFYFPHPLETMINAMSHVPGHRFLPNRNFKNLIIGDNTVS